MQPGSRRLEQYRQKRSYDFSVAVNSNVHGREHHIPLGLEVSSEELIARAAALLSALEEQIVTNDDKKAQRLARAMARHLEGASWLTVGREAGKLLSERAAKKDFIAHVAFMAAAVHEGRPYNWQAYVADEAKSRKKPMAIARQADLESDAKIEKRERIVLPYISIRETLDSLGESGAIGEGVKNGLLLLFEQWENVDELDPKKVDDLVAATRRALEQKIYKKRAQCPNILKVTGSRRDGHRPLVFHEVFNREVAQQLVVTKGKPEGEGRSEETIRRSVEASFAYELKALFTPTAYA